MNFIDTHTHLFLEEFDSDRENVIKRAINAGIQKMVLPNVDSSTIQPMFDTCNLAPANCLPAIGLHPTSVKENYADELNILESSLKQNNFVAIGEIGIDLYWDKTFFNEQVMALERQLDWAVHYNLPVILHCRQSFNEVYGIVRKYKNLKGVFHAFSGNEQDAHKVIDLGFYLGIGGVVTFKNSGLDKVLENISLEHIVLETDSPYLTPVPFRGKRNESAHIILVAEKIAQIKNVDVQKVETTTSNAKDLFNIH
jgi:TatD DNase family protein